MIHNLDNEQNMYLAINFIAGFDEMLQYLCRISFGYEYNYLNLECKRKIVDSILHNNRAEDLKIGPTCHHACLALDSLATNLFGKDINSLTLDECIEVIDEILKYL